MGFQQDHERSNPRHEDLEGPLPNCLLTPSLTRPQPIGWNFATSGSTNLHAFNNKIVAVSDSDVSSVDTLQRMDLISIPSPSLSIRELQMYPSPSGILTNLRRDGMNPASNCWRRSGLT